MIFFVRVKPTAMRSAPSKAAGAAEINSKVERFMRWYFRTDPAWSMIGNQDAL